MHRNHFAANFPAILLLLLSISTSAQLSFQSLLTDTTTHWVRQWNNPIPTADGGYVIGAISVYTDTAGNDHAKSILAKLDANGVLQWNKTYACSDWTVFYALKQLSNGYIISLLTNTIANASDYHLLLVRTDLNGDTLWTRRYLHGGSCVHIDQMSNGDFMLFGSDNPMFNGQDHQVMRVDSTGNIIWIKEVVDNNSGGPGLPGFVTADGNIILWHTYNWLYKLDTNFNILWSVPMQFEDGVIVPADLVELTDGSFMMVGSFSYDFGPEDMFMAKVSSSGQLLWIKAYGGAKSDQGWNVTQLSDGNLLIAGVSRSQPIYNKTMSWLLKTDTAGQVIYSRLYWKDTVAWHYSYTITELGAGNFLLGGEYYLEDFSTIDLFEVSAPVNQPDVCQFIEGPDSMYIITPDSSVSKPISLNTISFSIDDTIVNVSDGLLVQTYYCIGTNTDEPNVEDSEPLFVYPNPANDYVSLRLGKDNSGAVDVTLCNVLGEEVVRVENYVPESLIKISSLAAGIFYVKMRTTHCDKSVIFIRQ